jgi:hypothetical protein
MWSPTRSHVVADAPIAPIVAHPQPSPLQSRADGIYAQLSAAMSDLFFAFLEYKTAPPGNTRASKIRLIYQGQGA